MPRRVLDTNVLINYWGDRSRGITPRDITIEHTERWGADLADLQASDAILTPIYIEFVCGKGSAHEVRLARAYLAAFELVDDGRIVEEDWKQATRIAERVPRDGLRRQMGDCLIRAVCLRLNLELFTFEKRFPY